MLRRILRSLPHSSKSTNTFSPVFRDRQRRRTLVASLKPSLFVFLGVSVATFATIITIHADAAADSETTPDDKEVEIPKTAVRNYLLPQETPPSPTTDETLRSSAVTSIPPEKGVVGISRVDTILLPSNDPCEDVYHQKIIRFSGTLTYSLFGVYDGHNGTSMSSFLGETLIYAVLGQLFQLYYDHASALKPDHVDVGHIIDVGSRSNTVKVDYVPEDGDPKIQHREGEKVGLIDELDESIYPSDKEIDLSIKKAFMFLDSLIVDDLAKLVLRKRFSKEEGVRLLTLPNAGSCALLGIYNNVKRSFKVAIAGDSRAVLGRRVAAVKKNDDDDDNTNYAYETHVLSLDQNAYNPEEVKRLEAAHPGEKIFENGRTLGWGLSRAFGDAVCKWSLETQKRLHEEYLGDQIRSNCLTPPYFTAEPEITTTTIRKGDFVVLASDGLWDCLTNEEVVGLVGGWLEMRGKEVMIGKGEGIGEGEMVMQPLTKFGPSEQDNKGFGKDGWPKGGSDNNNNLKVEDKDDDDGASTIWERTDLPVTSLQPDGTSMYKWWQAKKQFVNVDGNAAIHLARNAIGGADTDLTGALLRMKPPRSRRYRDDICIQVIFFD